MRINEKMELSRHNVTPAQFCAYVRSQIKKRGIVGVSASDIDLEYWKNGGDGWNFYVEGDGERPTEKSVAKPYEIQTYVWHDANNIYNIIMEFDFWDDKTGDGFFYFVNRCSD